MIKLTKLLKLLIIILLLAISKNSVANMIVSDPGAYNYFSNFDKNNKQILDMLQNISLSNSGINTSIIDVKNSVKSESGYFLLHTDISDYINFYYPYDPKTGNYSYFNPDPKQSSLTGNPYFKQITTLLDQTFPETKVNDNRGLKKQEWIQNNLRHAIILARTITGSAGKREGQISDLAEKHTNSLKQSVDLTNNLLSEMLIEIKTNNLLLARLTEIIAVRDYTGKIVYDQDASEESDRSRLRNSSISSGSGKFVTMTR